MKQLIVALLLCATWAQAQPSNARLKIGEEFVVNHQTAHPYTAGTTGAVVFEQEFYNKNSAYIRLYFEDFDLGPDDYVEISSHNTGESLIYADKGKIVDKEGTMISDFWSSVVFDERVTVRLHTRSGSAQHYGFRIAKVAYGYSNEQLAALLPSTQSKSSCGPNDIQRIACATTQQKDKAKAVCRLFVNGTHLCTGWLLGSQGHVMTNEHCITNTTEAQNTDFIFNDQYVDCNPSSTTKTTVDIVAASSTIIKKNADMDYCLVVLPVNPTSTYGYLQLDENGPSFNQRVYIVHHAGGGPKSITSTSGFTFDGTARVASMPVGATSFSYYAYTQGGSSGAPVFNYFSNKVLGVNAFKSGCTAGSDAPSNLLIADLSSHMPTDGITGAVGCVVSFPYTESFESGDMGTWSQGTNDNHNWSNTSGGTPSVGTGPSSAYSGSRYAFVESSSPYFNRNAILNSPCFNLSNLTSPLLKFRYHMYGSDMGNLALQMSYNNTHWSTIWTRHSNRNNTWREVMIDLDEIMTNAPDRTQVRFRFVANTGSSYRSDIAIDYIQLMNPTSTSCYRGSTVTYDFEDHRYPWTQSPTSLFGWVQQTGQSPVVNGPSGAQSGLDYLHIYPSQGFPSIGSNGTLTSDCIWLWAYNQPRISFYYNLPGSPYFRNGYLKLEISNDNGATWTALWIRTFGTNSQWTRASVSIASYASQTVKIRFVGTANSGESVALDNISIYSSGSAPAPDEDEPDNNALQAFDEVAPTLMVSPNPFQDYLNIETTLPHVQGYRLLNLQGQVVQQGDLQGNTTQIRLQNIVPGMYFIALYNQETQLVQKVIKQ